MWINFALNEYNWTHNEILESWLFASKLTPYKSAAKLHTPSNFSKERQDIHRQSNQLSQLHHKKTWHKKCYRYQWKYLLNDILHSIELTVRQIIILLLLLCFVNPYLLMLLCFSLNMLNDPNCWNKNTLISLPSDQVKWKYNHSFHFQKRSN